MPKTTEQVEGGSPKVAEVFPARICECGAVHDRPEAGCPECGSVIAREAGEAVFVSSLLSDAVVDRIARRRYAGRPRGMVFDGVKAAVRGDLQAAIDHLGGTDAR